MEKHAERRNGQRCTGLLSVFRYCPGQRLGQRPGQGPWQRPGQRPWLLLLLLLALTAQAGFAAASHADYLRSLSFRCQDDYVFSASNTVFAVDIAYLPPEEISVYLNSIPNNVELVSIKKVTYIPPASSSQSYGTHVEITVRFSSTGDVKLFAADLETKEGFFKIPFQRVHVWANMQILKPELSVSIDNAAAISVPAAPAGKAPAGKKGGQGKAAASAAKEEILRVTAGSHIRYTVRVKYASAVKSIRYDIPENSIFRELARYMDPDGDGGATGDFSPDFQDAVRYDWQPLTPGDFSLPAVRLVVQAYNGSLVSLPFPAIAVHVDEAEAVTAVPEAGSGTGRLSAAFAEAFTETPVSPRPVESRGTLEDARRLAALYERERSSLPFAHAVMEERQELEQALDRDALPPLPRRPLFFMLCFSCLLFFSGTVLSVWRKSFSRAAFCFVISLVFAIFTLIYGIRLSRSYAVSKGGILYPIPESGISRGGELPVASVVLILKKAGDWYYVSFNDTNGWISADAVILVP